MDDKPFPTFDELMGKNDNKCDYWVMGNSYKLKGMIMSWGGYFQWDVKRWRIDWTSKDCLDFKALTKLGLKLIKIEGTD